MGALPLLYAFWGAAPDEIIEFLLESYLSLYPGFEFNWKMMVDTMGRTGTSKESIEKLLHVQQMYIPVQPIDLEDLLVEFFVIPVQHDWTVSRKNVFYLLLWLVCAFEVEALAFNAWCDGIRHMMYTANYLFWEDNLDILHSIQYKLAHFEDNLPKLNEATNILELVCGS